MGWSKVVKGARPPLAVQENPRYFKVFSQILISGSDGKKKKKNLPAVWETQVQSLEKGMTTHFSILARRTPWTEEPGRLQSMGSQRVRHD